MFGKLLKSIGVRKLSEVEKKTIDFEKKTIDFEKKTIDLASQYRGISAIKLLQGDVSGALTAASRAAALSESEENIKWEFHVASKLKKGEQK